MDLGKILGGGAGAAGGLGDAADSWVSTGANQPVSATDLASALGSDTISHVAGQAGVSPDDAAAGLAQILPQVVDHLTPDGQVPDDASVQTALGGLLGPADS